MGADLGWIGRFVTGLSKLAKADHRRDVNNFGCSFGPVVNRCQRDKYGIQENSLSSPSPPWGIFQEARASGYVTSAAHVLGITAQPASMKEPKTKNQNPKDNE